MRISKIALACVIQDHWNRMYSPWWGRSLVHVMGALKNRTWLTTYSEFMIRVPFGCRVWSKSPGLSWVSGWSTELRPLFAIAFWKLSEPPSPFLHPGILDRILPSFERHNCVPLHRLGSRDLPSDRTVCMGRRKCLWLIICDTGGVNAWWEEISKISRMEVEELKNYFSNIGWVTMDFSQVS